jgi:hypothetical protein
MGYMENKKNQKVKKHKNIVLYQNIGGHMADPLPYSRKNRVGGTTLLSHNIYYVK